MLSVIAAALSAIAGAIKFATDWLRHKKDDLLIALGGQKQKVEDLEGRLDALDVANKAREDSRHDVERGDADGLLDDDGFRRKNDGDD
jgi:hypothetical protein